MEHNIENKEPKEYKYKFSYKYGKKELIDAYMDRKARLRYKRATLGTIAFLAIAIISSKSNYFGQATLYKNYIFWCLSAVLFMMIFLRNHHKFMWKSMSGRSFLPQTNTYDIYLCEDYVNIIYPITGINKAFSYDEVDIYEVKDYFILENEYLNGFNIAKEKMDRNAVDNVRSFFSSKTKIKNLELPFPLRKFSRMPFYAEIIIVALLLVPVLTPSILDVVHTEQVKIGERVVCENLGITVKETGHVKYGKNSAADFYKVDLTLENFEKGSKKYSQVDFSIVGKDGKEQKAIGSVLDPKEIKSGTLNEKESLRGTLYFVSPSNEEPVFLVYKTFDKSNSKQYTAKIHLVK